MLLAIVGWALLTLAVVAFIIVINIFWADILSMMDGVHFERRRTRYKGRHRDEPPWVWCR